MHLLELLSLHEIINMLGLKLETDPRWVNIVEGNLELLRSDLIGTSMKVLQKSETISSGTILTMTLLTPSRVNHGNIESYQLTLD